MATTEELLETLISIEEETQVIQETQSSDIQTMTSQIDVLTSDVIILKEQLNILSSGQIDESTPNYLNEKLQLINDSQGGYLKEEVLANNEALYSDIVSVKEMMSINFIIFGVIVAFFIVFMIVKGFFRNVSN